MWYSSCTLYILFCLFSWSFVGSETLRNPLICCQRRREGNHLEHNEGSTTFLWNCSKDKFFSKHHHMMEANHALISPAHHHHYWQEKQRVLGPYPFLSKKHLCGFCFFLDKEVCSCRAFSGESLLGPSHLSRHELAFKEWLAPPRVDLAASKDALHFSRGGRWTQLWVRDISKEPRCCIY